MAMKPRAASLHPASRRSAKIASNCWSGLQITDGPAQGSAIEMCCSVELYRLICRSHSAYPFKLSGVRPSARQLRGRMRNGSSWPWKSSPIYLKPIGLISICNVSMSLANRESPISQGPAPPHLLVDVLDKLRNTGRHCATLVWMNSVERRDFLFDIFKPCVLSWHLSWRRIRDF